MPEGVWIPAPFLFRGRCWGMGGCVCLPVSHLTAPSTGSGGALATSRCVFSACRLTCQLPLPALPVSADLRCSKLKVLGS